MLEEMEKRQRDAESLNRQRQRDRGARKAAMNKDLIDFAHPEESGRGSGQNRRDSPEDEVAQPIVDKKQILKEMKMKRKQEHESQLREKEIKENKKRLEMAKLENFLKQQKDDFQKQQFL